MKKMFEDGGVFSLQVAQYGSTLRIIGGCGSLHLLISEHQASGGEIALSLLSH